MAAQVAGAVVALDVKAGDVVKAGQVLAAHRRARGRAERRRRRGAGAGRARRAGSGDASEFERQKQLFEQELHQPGGARARRGAVQGGAGAKLSAQLAQRRRGAHAVGLLRRARRPMAAWWPTCPWCSATWRCPAGRCSPCTTRRRCASPPRSRRRAVAAAGGASRARRSEIARRGCWPGQAGPCAAAAHGRSGHAHARAAPRPARRLTGVAPGMFARAWLPAAARRWHGDAGCSCRRRRVVRRAEMTGVYVIGSEGHGRCCARCAWAAATATASRCCQRRVGRRARRARSAGGGAQLADRSS